MQHPGSGTFYYHYSISSGKSNWAAQQAWRQGMNFNAALIPVVSEDELSTKSLPPEQSFLSVKGDSLVVSALKKADKGDGIVMRVFEETGQQGDSRVRFLGQDRNMRTLNLLEGPAAENGKVASELPFEIRTVELDVQSAQESHSLRPHVLGRVR